MEGTVCAVIIRADINLHVTTSWWWWWWWRRRRRRTRGDTAD